MLNRKSLTLFTSVILLLSMIVMPSLAQDTETETKTSIAIAPLNGTVRTPIQVIANGFPANTSVYIGLGVPQSEYDIITTAQSDAYGLVTTQFLIPSYIDDTTVDELVVVVGTQDPSIDDVISVPFTLMADEEIRTPFVNIVPRSGVAGSRVTVSAIGYPANTDIILGVRPQNGEFDYSLRVSTDNNGSFITDITIPQDARANRDWIVLAEVENDRDYQAFSPVFSVTGAEPTPQPDGTAFTRSDIYLIALGDISGEVIGCGDMAVPVEVVFDSTIAPLSASLEALFNIDTQMYGQSGLYNALYQADLTLNGINIQDGVATIDISGQLVVNGACDTPRAIAQIERTALQFSTINEVKIIINGQPYL